MKKGFFRFYDSHRMMRLLPAAAWLIILLSVQQSATETMKPFWLEADNGFNFNVRETRQLPISAFIDPLRPTARSFWNDPVTLNWLYFDAFGKRNAALGLELGTTVSGKVTIVNLGDGTERVTILIHTSDAVCWGTAFNSNTNLQEPAFGHTPEEIANGASPSLGDGMMRIQLIQPEGWELPLYSQINVPPRVNEFLSAEITCRNGELRTASGFPDGTRGFAQTSQTGLFSTGVPSGCPAEDCWTAEHVAFRAY